MPIKLFIAGTDTGIGKTTIGVKLLKHFHQQGLSTLGLKPVASGCSLQNGVYYNDDALALWENSSIKLSYDQINPFAFEPPIAPHLAAKQAGVALDVQSINQKLQFALDYSADVTIIEGAGGWYTPLNDHETLADFVKANQLDVVLVVGMRLGCLNHAILTHQAMQQDGVRVVGWIANCLPPDMAFINENIETLKSRLSIPFWGTDTTLGAYSAYAGRGVTLTQGDARKIHVLTLG